VNAEDARTFTLAKQPQEPPGPGGRTLEGDDLERWRERFRPFLRHIKRKKVVLALSGGGLAFPCHVSALRVLELLEVPVSAVYGTSAGAVVGGLHAAGLSTVDLERVMLAIESPEELFGFAARFPALRLVSAEIVRKLRGATFDSLGIYDLSTVEEYVERVLREYVGRVPTLGELEMDFSCVAYDIGTGEPQGNEPDMTRKKVFSTRRTPNVRLSEAIAASMSIPGILTPKKIDGRHYIDGGPVEHLPISTAHGDWVSGGLFRRKVVTIGVDLGSGGEALTVEHLTNPVDLILYTNSVQSRTITQYNLLRCHNPRRGNTVVLIRPKTLHIGLADIEKIPLAIQSAYAETVEQLAGPGFLRQTESEIARTQNLLGCGSL